MKARLFLATSAVSLALAGSAHALPKGLLYVDPAAPCYRWPAVDYDRDGVFDRVDHCVSTPAGCVVDQYGCSVDADGDKVCDGLDQCPDTPAGVKVGKQGCASGEPGAGTTPVPPKPPTRSERELIERARIRLENVYFETNSAHLLPESEESLREAGEALEKYPNLRIEVEGHTDTRGPGRYNMKLSHERAEAVREYLLRHFRLKPGNVSAEGYGETRPETRERGEKELSRNRRVELRVLNPNVLPKGVKVEQR